MWLGLSPFCSPNKEEWIKEISRLHADRDVCKGNTDIPKGATFWAEKTPKLGNGFLQNAIRP